MSFSFDMASGSEDVEGPHVMKTPSLLQTLELHKSDVNWCSFKQDILATCSADKTVRLWRFNSEGALEEDGSVSPLVGHSYYVHCCQFSPCGKILASSSTDGRVILWEVASGKSLHELSHESLSCIKICRFSPDGTRLLTGSDDESLVLWDIQGVYAGVGATERPNSKTSSQYMRSFVGHEGTIFAASFTPGGEIVVSGCSNGELRFWDALYGHDPALVLLNVAHDLGVTCCTFSPAKYIQPEGRVRFQDRQRSSELSFLLASAGNCNTVKLWRVSTWPEFDVKHLHTLSVHVCSVSSVAFSPDGAILGSASTDRSVALWDPNRAYLLHHWACHSRYLTTCAFYRHKHRLILATGGNDKTVKLWEVNRAGDATTTETTDDSSTSVDSPSSSCDVNVNVSHTVVSAEVESSVNKTSSKVTKISEWNVEQVCLWLSDTLGLKEYANLFRVNAIDGQELISMDNQTLVELGVEALGHRNKIMRGLNKVIAHPYLAFHGTSEVETPDEYLCPITHELMRDPVIAADGYSYERSAMEEWLRNGGIPVSPMTNAPLLSPTLTPNRSLKLLIERFIS